VFGLSLFESFESDDVSLTGRVPMPDFDKEQSVGGHALCICGYSDSAEHVIIRNSWGKDWGDDGFCYVPYAMFDRKLDVAFDFWTCTWSD
jgi:C1A family cysteine protease